MTQDELEQAVAQAAADYVAQTAPDGSIISIGTAQQPNFFIDALAAMKNECQPWPVSEATRKRLEGHGIKVFDLNDVTDIPSMSMVPTEIDAGLNMIKGGGGALTREKIVAAVARELLSSAMPPVGRGDGQVSATGRGHPDGQG